MLGRLWLKHQETTRGFLVLLIIGIVDVISSGCQIYTDMLNLFGRRPGK